MNSDPARYPRSLNYQLGERACAVLDRFRFDTDVARLVGTSSPAITYWRQNGVPSRHVRDVCEAALVHPAEVRPDLYNMSDRAQHAITAAYGIRVDTEGYVIDRQECACA